MKSMTITRLLPLSLLLALAAGSVNAQEQGTREQARVHAPENAAYATREARQARREEQRAGNAQGQHLRDGSGAGSGRGRGKGQGEHQGQGRGEGQAQGEGRGAGRGRGRSGGRG